MADIREVRRQRLSRRRARHLQQTVLGVLLLAAMLLAAVGLMQWWEDRLHFRTPAPTDQTAQAAFEAYRDRADTLFKLTSALIGLSSLYAMVLGVTTYLTAQQFADRARESFDRAKESSAAILERLTAKQKDFEQHYPVLAGFSESVAQVVKTVTELLLTHDERMDAFHNLSAADREKIRYYEQSIAYFEFLDVDSLKEPVSEIYRSLGKFYGAEGVALRGRLSSIEQVLSGTDTARTVAFLREEADSRFERARFYLLQSLRVNPRNFASLNDLGFVLSRDFGDVAGAELAYRQSLTIQPRQQRAHFNLAVRLMDEGEFKAAGERLTTALAESNWQSGPPSRERQADLRYNLACCYSHRAERAAGAERDRLLDLADAELTKALTYRSGELVEVLRKDLQADGDLGFFATVRPDRRTRILDEVGTLT